MTAPASVAPQRRSDPWTGSHLVGLSALLIPAWLTPAFALGAAGVFVRPPGSPPFALLVALSVPILGFVGGFWSSDLFRDFVRTVDLPLLTGIQAWRFAGFTFIALYTQGVLPGYFAWPAGLGDIAIGLTAPWVMRALQRDSRFAASGTFATWNLLGILDLVVAISMGAIVPLLLNHPLPELATTAPMTRLPLVLVPAFFVPLFFIFHLVALVQARSLTNEAVVR